MKPATSPATPASPLANEADIGSGEKTPADHETEELIRQIPPLPPSGSKHDPAPTSTDQKATP